MNTETKLNLHSKKVFDILKLELPEILKFSSKHPSDEGDYFLKIEIDAPNEKAEYGIFFDTEDNMFTLGFDCFHCHFYQFAEADFRADLSKTIDMLRKIMSNELFVVKSLKKDVYNGSFLIEKKDLSIDKIKKNIIGLIATLTR